MNILTNKILLFFICILLNISSFESLTDLVVVSLIALAVSCFQFAFPREEVQLSLTVIYFVAALCHTELFLLFPLIVSDCFNSSKKYVVITTVSMIFISLYVYYHNILPYLLLCYFCSFYLSYLSAQLNTVRSQNIILKDTGRENEILAKEKADMILKNQTTQIYAATLKERNRIAREIHDNVGHLITRSILQLAALNTINDNENLSPHFENLSQTLNQAMTSIRNSVHDIHNESIDLKYAINELTKDITNFHIFLDYSITSNPEKEIKYEFLAIIKEALNNAVKHSNGNEIKIIVREHPAFYQLLIEDNGTGAKVKTSNGIGLTNIRTRVKNLNGTIQISSNNNFRIFISIMK